MKREIVRIGVGFGVAAMVAALAACGGQGAGAKAPEAADPPLVDGAPGDGAGSGDVKRGAQALEAGDLAGARASLEAALQKNPRQADAHHYLGVVSEQEGQRAEAERHYREAIALAPGFEEPSLNLAAMLVESGKFDEAASLMRSAAGKNPKSAAVQVNLAMALSGKGDVDGANKAFEEAIRLAPSDAIHVVTYASHLAQSGRHADAAAKLKQAEALAASDPGVLASIALEYKELRDFDKCVSVLDRAISQKDVAELRIYRGTCKLGKKDLAGATSEFKDAVAKEPNNALARYSLGNALADGGKLTEAVAEWEACLRLAPEGPQAQAAERKIAIAKTKAGAKKK